MVSSIPDSYNTIKRCKGLESIVIPETGCFLSEDIPLVRFDEKEFHVMWVGKFDFRKQLPLALKAIAMTGNSNIILDVYGSGSDEQVDSAKSFADHLGIPDKVIWHGNQSNDVVMNAMRRAQLFFFTSVSEDTSTVVLEAVSNRLPVLCFNACGMAAVIDDKVGRKIPLTTPSQSAQDFSRMLNELEGNRDLLKQMFVNCKQRQIELSWDEKAKTMVGWYEKIVKA